MLPPDAYFSRLLKEHFILYQPRDIVSGDFYWIKQVKQYVVLVVADCNGHGVPGAFMSMLGMSNLNEIVQRREMTQPNQVLNELRIQIKNSLRQHGKRDESKDGIDMAICVVDLESMKMKYAGANIPLYVIKDVKGTPKLREIKSISDPFIHKRGSRVRTFEALKVNHHRDNWSDQYASERYDITEQEFLSPSIGFLQRKTSRYVNFRDCFTCPTYGGSSEIELVGYYIPQPGGTVLEGGYGYNPENPYGGNQGILTIGATEDIGSTEVKIDGEYVGTIANYWPDGLTCDQPRALNVSRSDGSYTLTAVSNKGYYWEGIITFIQGTCDTVELLLSKKGISASQAVYLAPRSSAGSTQE